MTTSRRVLIIRLENRPSERAVSPQVQSSANEKSLSELKDQAEKKGLLVEDHLLISPDQPEDVSWLAEVKAIAEPLMRPTDNVSTSGDCHSAGVNVGKNRRSKSMIIRRAGKPTIEIKDEQEEVGISINLQVRQIGLILEKMHEMGCKICVTITNGVVRLFGKGKDDSQAKDGD